MTTMEERAFGPAGDQKPYADSLARKAWRALSRGTGMHLTADEVEALHHMEGDGFWWQSFNPAIRNLSKGQSNG